MALMLTKSNSVIDILTFSLYKKVFDNSVTDLKGHLFWYQIFYSYTKRPNNLRNINTKMEFGNEFDLTRQQIVLLDEIDMPAHENNDFINSPVNLNSCIYEPFEETERPECTMNNSSTQYDAPQHQLHIIKNRNGIRYMKFKKSKKVVKSEQDQQSQQCPVMSCRALFTSKVKLRKHIQEHAFKKKHRCDICYEEFNVLENLTLHIALHSGDGRCPQCGKVFRRLASLEGHIKTHFKSELKLFCKFSFAEIPKRPAWESHIFHVMFFRWILHVHPGMRRNIPFGMDAKATHQPVPSQR